MFHYIGVLILIVLTWGMLKYLKWRRNVYEPLNKLNGPTAYPFIGNLYIAIGIKRSDIFKLFLKIVAKYGRFFRIFNGFQGEIHIMKPDHLELILANSTHIKKGKIYDKLKLWLGDGLLISDGQKWFSRRKMITPAFHFKILEHFMEVFIDKSKLLVNNLREKSDGTSFDVYPYITHCSLDIICETAMGVSINAMADRNSPYVRAVYNTTELTLKRQLSILQQTPLYYFMEDRKQFRKNLITLHGFTNKVISDRKKYLKQNPCPQDQIDDESIGRKKRLSLLDMLLSNSESLTNSDIRNEVDTFMFEGHDTTTAGICWALFLLGQNQQIQEKAYQEVKTVLFDKKTPESISDLNELKYLECCIKEALRLYPSVPFIMRHLTQNIKIDGIHIPKGTDVALHIYQVHRDPEHFPDPEKYDPDRFFPDNSKNRHPYAYVPFSAGPRNCIGQRFAMYEEKCIISSILRSYKILPVDTLETINIMTEIILRPECGLKIALVKRND